MLDSSAKPANRVKVLLPLPLGDAYDYRVAADLALNPGDFVLVPLGRRRVSGVVWEGAEKGCRVAEEKLKDVIGLLDVPPMPEALRRLVDWVAAYTMQPRGAVLKMAMSVPAALEPPKASTAYRQAGQAASIPEIKMTPARRRVLATLEAGPPRTAAELARAAGVSAGVISGLANAGALEKVEVFEEAVIKTPRYAPPELSPSQALAASKLAEKAEASDDSDGFSVSLLDGVPGSGKTEVYFAAVAQALARGRQVLVLLPEIALTSQWLERFRLRFGVLPAQWHSELSQAARRRTWRAVAEGKAGAVVGARSALFLPFPDLGLVVVDEEHDQSYKQEEGVIYNARDMSVVRARLGGISVVLASATPSLESVTNVRQGRYTELLLPDRYAGAAMPDVALADMRAEPPPRGRWLSPVLRSALGKTFAAGEQAMLFLNRRGYAPLTLCRTCGHRLQCRRCTAWLVEHRGRANTPGKSRLQCHHCGYVAPVPDACPECGATESLVACGPGVERLAEEASALFPGVRQAIAASDTIKGP
ncbi:MAG TPA: primosomal protein N', partial [Alphaproteobacteria bacterium]|nr:primosomal protein N' [Alphaproteobacteria bacterium]